MSSSREQESKLLQAWKADSIRLLVSFSGSGIGFNAEAFIKNLGYYELELVGDACTIKVNLGPSQLLVRHDGLLEILLTSGDRVVLREAVS